MSIDVTVERRIARAPEDVADFAMDPGNDARWIGALKSVRKLTDGPVRAGSRVERIASFLGREIRYVNEIDALDPGRRLSMHSVEAPFPMTVSYEFEPAGDGTRARIRAGGDAGRYYRLAGPLLSALVKRGIARDLKQLEKVLREPA
jgi:carbon monoxide dehydrogenase subunit G